MRNFYLALGIFALALINFIVGRETTPAAYIKMGSNSTLSGAELRNVHVETQDDAHDVKITNIDLLIDVPWWRR